MLHQPHHISCQSDSGLLNSAYRLFGISLGASMEYRPCTAGGHHNVTSLNLKGDRDPCSKTGFREVIIRCNGDEVVEFIRVRFIHYK